MKWNALYMFYVHNKDQKPFILLAVSRYPKDFKISQKSGCQRPVQTGND